LYTTSNTTPIRWRHQLDAIHSEVDEMIQAVGGIVENVQASYPPTLTRKHLEWTSSVDDA